MPLAPKSMQDVEQPALVSDPAAVREQLHRLLAHPLFSNSKRYPALLAYTVEQTLLGNAAELKERSIGIEVFGRDTHLRCECRPGSAHHCWRGSQAARPLLLRLSTRGRAGDRIAGGFLCACVPAA